jgi:hypothetical protein
MWFSTGSLAVWKKNGHRLMGNPIVLVTLDMEKPRELDRREKLWKSEKTESYFEPIQFYTTNHTNEGLLYLDDEVGEEQFVKMYFK